MLKTLESGYSVIASRYYFSSYAFQSEYVPLDWVVHCNSLCKQYLKPDVIFYLNVDPEVCVERINRGRFEKEIYETREKTEHAHKQYLSAFEKYGADEHIQIIDGNKDAAEVGEDIWDVVQLMMKQ